MKSKISILLALVMVLALFAGCVNEGSKKAGNSPKPNTGVSAGDSGENARISGGGASSFDIEINTQGKTLDDIKDDSGASFKGSGWDTSGFASAADQ